MRKIIITFILLFSILITGCETPLETKIRNIESNIINDSNLYMQNVQKLEKNFENEGNLIINKYDNRFEIYQEISSTSPYIIPLPINFYIKNEFVEPEIYNQSTLPEVLNNFLLQAKEISCNYVNYSNFIKTEDKEACIIAIENVKCYYGIFIDENLNNIMMITKDNSIYINSLYTDYISIYHFLHELIHVICNQTNKGSSYEFHCYRACKIIEAITDIITIELLEAYNIDGYESSPYTDYYEFAYYAIAKFNMLETYYYSDNYANIIEDVGQNAFDAFILSTHYSSEYYLYPIIYRLMVHMIK